MPISVIVSASQLLLFALHASNLLANAYSTGYESLCLPICLAVYLSNVSAKAAEEHKRSCARLRRANHSAPTYGARLLCGARM